jgi:hypothetical protein
MIGNYNNITYLNKEDLIERYKDKLICDVEYQDFKMSLESKIIGSNFVVYIDSGLVKILKSRLPFTPEYYATTYEIWKNEIEPYFKEYKLPPLFQTSIEAKKFAEEHNVRTSLYHAL